MATRVVPEKWMPACRMERVIVHWTGGGHHASSNDREHYHLLIEADGRLVRGDHSISDNVSTGDRDYAAHTRGKNTGSIGVSACCMLNAMERPFKPGPYPMTETQWAVMALAVADLCDRYDITVTPATVLGHGEVTKPPQAGKWDPLVLPWQPKLTKRQVGDQFRERVKAALAGTGTSVATQLDQLPPVTVLVDGELLTDEGVLKGGTSWCPLRLLADSQQWTILAIDADSAIIRTADGDYEVVAMIRGERGYIQTRDLCSRLGWSEPQWDPERRSVAISVSS